MEVRFFVVVVLHMHAKTGEWGWDGDVVRSPSVPGFLAPNKPTIFQHPTSFVQNRERRLFQDLTECI
jgi:hypothetical protein